MSRGNEPYTLGNGDRSGLPGHVAAGSPARMKILAEGGAAMGLKAIDPMLSNRRTHPEALDEDEFNLVIWKQRWNRIREGDRPYQREIRK